VVFTIRVHLTPLSQVAANPARLARFVQAWRTAAPDFRAYKHLHLYDELVAGVIGTV
jgi:dimethylamine monooxygenase subunit A